MIFAPGREVETQFVLASGREIKNELHCVLFGNSCNTPVGITIKHNNGVIEGRVHLNFAIQSLPGAIIPAGVRLLEKKLLPPAGNHPI
jgi:hypothetical protein